jgi:hypothetical protein
MLKVGTPLKRLAFSRNDHNLVTEIGSIILGPPPSHSIQEANWSAYCLEWDGSWITWNGNRILWIPPEYRPSSSMIRENTVAIGCPSGRVILIRFLPDPYSQESVSESVGDPPPTLPSSPRVDIPESRDNPLHVAAVHGHVTEIRALLTAGASVNVQGVVKETPLHDAAINGHVAAIIVLLEGGASVNAQEEDQLTLLHFAALNGHVRAMQPLLVAGASVDAKNKDQLTPLHVAAENGHVPAMHALLKVGASVNSQNKDQWTPLHKAALNGHEEAI